MARATVNGVTLQYELLGSGRECVVFLNGIAMSIGHWMPIAQPMSASRRCLLHDFRGQLLSDRPAGPYSLRGHADDLAELMRSLGIGKAHIVGTSYGGEVALEFAISYPGMVESLVVIDSVSELDPLLRATAEAWKTAALADPRSFYRGIIPWNYSSEYIAANAEALAKREAGVVGLPRDWFVAFAALCDAFLETDITPRLGRIGCGTLVLVAERDILKHSGFARVIAAGIPGARLETIPGAGHAVAIERPDTVRVLVEAFLEGR